MQLAYRGLSTTSTGFRRSVGHCRRISIVTRNNKQYVPSDSFGGSSPEATASKALRNLFTFVAARIVLAQLEGSGRGAIGAYDKQSYDDLYTFLQNEKLSDSDEWLAKLMRTNSALALRLMEVRLAYATEDFEWDQLKKLSIQNMNKGNVQIMRKTLTASFQAPLGNEPNNQDINGPGDEQPHP